jgi:glutamine transport system ATP-binding protein
MIKVENVSYKYSGGTEALDDVSIEFPKGTISAVLGESGSGKTTLLMCLGQFYEPKTGKITYDGRNIFDIPEMEYRRHVGIVFQDLYLFPHLTVLENMNLAMVHILGKEKDEASVEALETLDRLGIRELEKSYPSQISGGQAQRAAIARGLLLKPEYLLLDEPTSALDIGTTDEFAKWLLDLKDETNFIIVTHDILFAEQVASSGVHLSEGQITHAGEIDTIINHIRGRINNANK